MPVNPVWTSKNGQRVRGYRWGSSGKIYTGPGAREKAAAQGRAAYAAGYRNRKNKNV